jgi:hypothetical protein
MKLEEKVNSLYIVCFTGPSPHPPSLSLRTRISKPIAIPFPFVPLTILPWHPIRV